MLFQGLVPPIPGEAPPEDLKALGTPFQQVYMADELKRRKHESRSHMW